MNLKYVNTKEETLEYIMFERVKSKAFESETKSLRNMYRVIAGLFALWGIISLVSYFTGKDVTKLATAVSSFMIALFTLAFTKMGVFIRKWFMKREISKSLEKKDLAETEISIDARNLTWESAGDKGSVKLTEQIHVDEVKNMYFITSHKCRLVIPRRVFKDENEHQKFRKMLNIDNRQGV